MFSQCLRTVIEPPRACRPTLSAQTTTTASPLPRTGRADHARPGSACHLPLVAVHLRTGDAAAFDHRSQANIHRDISGPANCIENVRSYVDNVRASHLQPGDTCEAIAKNSSRLYIISDSVHVRRALKHRFPDKDEEWPAGFPLPWPMYSFYNKGLVSDSNCSNGAPTVGHQLYSCGRSRQPRGISLAVDDAICKIFADVFQCRQIRTLASSHRSGFGEMCR